MFLILKKRTIFFAFACIVMVLAAYLLLSNYSPQVVSTNAAADNWGLSFREKGKTPVGNATPEYLKQYDAYFVGDTNQKVLYLTFDAGYENGYTASILDTLKNHNVKAAFFLVGNYIKTSPELVKRMTDEGHVVGNHTFSHPDMSKIAQMEDFKKEISGVEDLYKQTTGQELQKFYRPPQGKYSENNLKQAQQLGYKTVFWSLAYVDWYTDKQPTRQQAFDKILPRIHPGAIILLHSTSKTNSEILDELITKLEQEGYTFGTLTDLCAPPAESQPSPESQ